MSNIVTNKGLVFTGTDLSRPRMVVEKEKLDKYFQGWQPYGSAGSVKSVQGYINTSYGEKYYVKIKIPETYPYKMPTINLPNTDIEENCPHKWAGGEPCIMKPDQWSSNYSLALIVAKTSLWLHKYDYWKRKGDWPGNQQFHGFLGFIQELFSD